MKKVFPVSDGGGGSDYWSVGHVSIVEFKNNVVACYTLDGGFADYGIVARLIVGIDDSVVTGESFNFLIGELLANHCCASLWTLFSRVS